MGKTTDLFKKIRDTISCKDGHNKGQKWYGPNRSRRYSNTQKQVWLRLCGVSWHRRLDLIECFKNYEWRFMTLYRRQRSRPSPRKRNAKKAK